jgi:DNA-directed RNA polymerase II subunit RPB1
MNIHALQT